MPRQELLQRLVGVGVFALALGLYVMTMAPTISLWDSGEFIACSYILGIPHPPGAPLYILVGRLFGLLPLAQVAQWVVFLSSLMAAAAAWCVYATTLILARGALQPASTNSASLLGAVAGGAIAALSLVCSHTFWFNATEAEVYAPSIFFVCLSVWLVLRWEMTGEDRWLLLIAYLLGLSGGVHLLSLLALPGILVLAWIADEKLRRLIAILVGLGLCLALLLALLQPSLAGGGFLLALGGGLYHLYRQDRRLCWLLAAVVFLFVLGYSTYGTLYIRSGLNPAIDENDPQTWVALISFLKREQYGTDSLLLGILKPKASRLYQFWQLQMKYFFQQFPFPLAEVAVVFRRATDTSRQTVLVSMLPYLLGLGGLLWHGRSDRRHFLLVLLLFVTMGFGLSAYLNMADPQPRERHYVFVGMFYAFALWMGLGWSGLVQFLGRRLARGPLVVAACGGLLLPLGMGFKLYSKIDRSADYLAYDYGYNLLQSCAPKSILFTNGDNDTFPLWFLQQVEGIRPDVDVVHLGLLNTGWYIKQLRRGPTPIEVPYSDSYIDQVLTNSQGRGLEQRYWPEPKAVELAGLDIEVTAPEGNMLRVQDIVVLKIIEANDWQRPVHFSVAVPAQNQLGLAPYLVLNGLTFQLVKNRDQQLNHQEMAHKLYNVFQWRGSTESEGGRDGAPLRLNYLAGVMQLGHFYQQKGMAAELGRLFEWAQGRIPFSWEAFYTASSYLRQTDQRELSVQYAESALDWLRASYSGGNSASYGDLMGLMDELIKQYRDAEWAEQSLRRIIAMEPGRWEAYYRLASVLGVQREYSAGLAAVEEYISRYGEVAPLVRIRKSLQQAHNSGRSKPNPEE